MHGILQTKRKNVYTGRCFPTTLSSYVFAANDVALTDWGIVCTFVFIDTPIARPLRLDTLHTSGVFRTVVIGEVSRYEIFVRFRGTYAERYEHVVFQRWNLWTSQDIRCRTRQSEFRHDGIDGFRGTKHTLIFSTIWKFWKSFYCKTDGCHLINRNSFG